MSSLRVVKAHAYGNDFLCAPAHEAGNDLPALARAMCHRHQGIGADGLLLYTLRDSGATMKLLNADGSWSELSGNGLRCLAALIARAQDLRPETTVMVDTDAGVKRLDLLAREGERYTFRAAMGQPTNVREEDLEVCGEWLKVTTLAIGNPQCVVRVDTLPDQARFERLGPGLATHPRFPLGTNVEFVCIAGERTLRILIWERGVGPTSASGTGACAAAVAAIAHGGAPRDLDVVAPGGTQRVEWRDDGIFLTGWAEVVCEGTWLARGHP